jgi:hypothetical protein
LPASWLDRRAGAASRVRVLFAVCLALLLPACDETAPQAAARTPGGTRESGFEARITGAYAGEVSGAGLLMLVPEAGFERRGYLVLSDGQGIRPHGVTFVLPRGLAPGRHELQTSSPLGIGTVPSVRVDRDMGESVLSSDRNTAGSLELEVFPADEAALRGSDVSGSFEFETEDAQGRRIRAKGSFSFQVE